MQLLPLEWHVSITSRERNIAQPTQIEKGWAAAPRELFQKVACCPCFCPEATALARTCPCLVERIPCLVEQSCCVDPVQARSCHARGALKVGIQTDTRLCQHTSTLIAVRTWARCQHPKLYREPVLRTKTYICTRQYALPSMVTSRQCQHAMKLEKCKRQPA